MPCIACSPSHSVAERIERGAPVVIIISDQHFPAVLPALNGDCVITVRVEDGLLNELEEAFIDRFRAYLHPHGALNPGSAILIGSISHLQARGLADYAEKLVDSLTGLHSRAGQGVRVAPLVPIPLQGIEKASVVRALADLDGWHASMPAMAGTTFPETRKMFWHMVAGMPRDHVTMPESYTIMLPVSLRNKRKAPITSEPIGRQLPGTIPPFTPGQEKAVLKSLFQEMNAAFGLTVDVSPDISRDSDPAASLDDSRTIFIGASHMCRTVNAWLLTGADVNTIAEPGWKPDKNKLDAATVYCGDLQLKRSDTVVMDLWSNSAYLGTDDSGLPCQPQRDLDDRKYHIVGQLQAAPKPLIQKIFQDSRPLIEATGEARVVFIVPFPRYLAAPCCDGDGHLTNFGTDEVVTEILRVSETVSTLIKSLPGDRFSIYNLTDLIGLDKDPSLMVTSSGSPAWGLDGVHLTEAGYTDVCNDIAAHIAELTSTQRGKRPRLESVVPGPPTKKRGGPAVRPSAWVWGCDDLRGSVCWPGRGRLPLNHGQRGSGWIGGGRGSGWRSGGRNRYGGRGRGYAGRRPY